jgi:hypothetical protein
LQNPIWVAKRILPYPVPLQQSYYVLSNILQATVILGVFLIIAVIRVLLMQIPLMQIPLMLYGMFTAGCIE